MAGNPLPNCPHYIKAWTSGIHRQLKMHASGAAVQNDALVEVKR